MSNLCTNTDDFFKEFNDFEGLKPKLTTQNKFSLGQIGSNIRFNLMNALGTGSASIEPNLTKKESVGNIKDSNSNNYFNIFPS